MNLLMIIPGTGSFYCGSCIRDNALALELRRLGHRVHIVPLYLPLVTDETPAPDQAPIYFGGVNVYLQQRSALFRHLPAWLDRPLDSPGLLRKVASRAGMTQAHDLGDLTLSMVQGREGRQAKEVDRLIRYLRHQPKPDLIVLSNAMLLGLVRQLKAVLGSPVLCTLQGEDSFIDALPSDASAAVWKKLQERAREVDRFIAVSDYYGQRMAKLLNLEPGKVRVVHNGIDISGLQPPESLPDPPVVGYLARLCADKGLGTLVQAFIHLRQRGQVPTAQLLAVGVMIGGDGAYVAQQQQILQGHGLESAARFLPNVDRPAKIKALQSMSVLSVPATYGESFGLYLLEAMACGVPVVQPAVAAFPEIIHATGGGILCPSADPHLLAQHLENLLLHPPLRQNLGQHGRNAVIERFQASHMAQRFAELAQTLIPRS